MFYKTSQEHEELRASIREWAEKEIKPIAFMLDKNSEFPGEQIKDFAKRGYMSPVSERIRRNGKRHYQLCNWGGRAVAC